MKKRLLLLLLCLTLLLAGCAAGKEQMPVFRIYGLSDIPGSDAISVVTVDWSIDPSFEQTQYLMCVRFDAQGDCVDVAMES